MCIVFLQHATVHVFVETLHSRVSSIDLGFYSLINAGVSSSSAQPLLASMIPIQADAKLAAGATAPPYIKVMKQWILQYI